MITNIMSIWIANELAEAYVSIVRRRPPVAKIRRLLAQLPIDPYLLMLIGTVALAAALPAQGAFRPIVDGSVYGAVATLFFLYGARLSPEAVWAGIGHWRLQSLVFASTFALFPLLGVAAMALVGSSLPRDLAIGLMFLTLLPSTVQSSIAFTSIARARVTLGGG
jgi:sodium/bile acid cotransporter 7